MGGSALAISRVTTYPVIAPLDPPIVTASGAVPNAPLLLIDLETNQGLIGRSYLIAYNPIALRPLDHLVRNLVETIVGAPVVPFDIEARLRKNFILFGGSRGLAGLAVSGIDTAVWDILAQAMDRPLATLLGGSPRPLQAYNSIGMIAPEEAEAQARATSERGFKALKVKLGWPDAARDRAVVEALRKALPAGVEIMVDFNQSLSVPEAIRRGRMLDDLALTWIEEPIRCDDYVGCAAVAAALDTPVQIGENFSGIHDMEMALGVDPCGFVMIDIQQIGGVTGWLRAAALAEAAGKGCSSHLFVETSAHLLAVTPTFHWLEYIDMAGAILRERPTVVDGMVTAPERAGNGLGWDEAAVKRYRID
ncbi:MAG TPA: enolase C-terminal domain-like protein [Allosphingosinicella sp.]|nr:enolase C-terminal domain-like protein [Allosphingosinicella sp.]